MEPIIEINHSHTCTKKIVNKNPYGLGGYSAWTCGKPAEYTNGQYFFCRHHSKMGRYVIRVCDGGEIKARFDTEEQVRANIHLYPGCIMQKIGTSKRRTLV